MSRLLAALASAGLVAGCLLVALAPGCARRTPPAAAGLAVDVRADTALGGRLAAPPPPARVWLRRVTPARAPGALPPLPAAPPESLAFLDDPAPAPDVEAGLVPPLLRGAGTLALPPGWSGPPASVELDVRVDESGRVSDALRAAGSRDTALVEAARRCALGMRFYPAQRAGRAVAVWCRQRFDLGGERR